MRVLLVVAHRRIPSVAGKTKMLLVFMKPVKMTGKACARRCSIAVLGWPTISKEVIIDRLFFYLICNLFLVALVGAVRGQMWIPVEYDHESVPRLHELRLSKPFHWVQYLYRIPKSRSSALISLAHLIRRYPVNCARAFGGYLLAQFQEWWWYQNQRIKPSITLRNLFHSFTEFQV